jgi:hypothetical protein
LHVFVRIFMKIERLTIFSESSVRCEKAQNSTNIFILYCEKKKYNVI